MGLTGLRVRLIELALYVDGIEAVEALGVVAEDALGVVADDASGVVSGETLEVGFEDTTGVVAL